MTKLTLQDFHFELPEELIAQRPLKNRGDSRLLHVGKTSGALADKAFADLPDLLQPGDLLVFNNTKVIPARLLGKKASGGKIEIMLERLTSEQECLALIRANKSPKAGVIIHLDCGAILEVTGREDDLFGLRLIDGAAANVSDMLSLFETHAAIPLPPYIERNADDDDDHRYQTVFAETPGAVAAPTASLHFDEAMLDKLVAAGINSAHVTLHVGSGTFLPVRVDDISTHKMHAETVHIDSKAIAKITQTKKNGGKVIAVGTTSVRSLESAAQATEDGTLQPFHGDTDIFIYPGYEFKIVDAMITNFHLPESTLLMLVSAFSSRETMLAAYNHAIEERYRFFSYGDAMFIS